MPLFDFVCGRCQHRFEELVAAQEIPECPKCHGREVRRELPLFAVSGPSTGESAPAGSCGTCGDPRGPGSCAR
jgi:putative FmdB family regulatory protein